MSQDIQLITVSVTTDASGDFSKTLQPRHGRLLQYRYVPDASTPLATGSDIDLVGATTGIIYINQDDIGTAAFTKAPRQITHGVDGVALVIEDFIWASGEALDFTVAQGGNELSGVFHFWFG